MRRRAARRLLANRKKKNKEKYDVSNSLRISEVSESQEIASINISSRLINFTLKDTNQQNSDINLEFGSSGKNLTQIFEKTGEEEMVISSSRHTRKKTADFGTDKSKQIQNQKGDEAGSSGFGYQEGGGYRSKSSGEGNSFESN